jgi:branched-chain amino acid transport system substrate-binding protein
MISSRLALLSAGALVAASLAACGGSGGGSGGSSANSDPYQVGFNSDLSGKYALNGVGQRDGFKAYFDYINSKGGINGHKVNVTYLDDASDVTRGTANTTQLITANNVSAMGGYLLSNVCGAAAVLANSHKVPINCSAVSDDLLQPVQPYVYTVRPSQSNEALPMVTLAKQLTGSTAKPKAAIIIYASAASLPLQKNLEALVKQNGWDLVDDEQVPLTATDVAPQVAKIAAAKPDVVMGSLYDPLAVSFMRGLAAANLKIPFANYDGATLQGSMLPLKDPSHYVLSSMSLDGQGDGAGLKQYRDATAADKVDPGKPFVNVGYVQALSIAEGLKACGFPCTGAQLQPALDKQSVDTGGMTSGKVGYTKDNHEGLKEVSFYVWDPASNAVKVALANTPTGSTSK